MAKNNTVDNNLEQAKVVAAKTSDFFEKNKKFIYGALAVIVIGIGVYFLVQYKNEKKVNEAKANLAEVTASFNPSASEEFVAANYDEISAHIAEYGDAAGKAVYLFAGIDAYKLGNYEEAIENLEKYSGDAILEARALCAIADANVELGNVEKAAQQYEAAAAKSDNVFNSIYLFKAAQAYEAVENYEAALADYNKVLAEYPNTPQGAIVEKYIARIEYR